MGRQANLYSESLQAASLVKYYVQCVSVIMYIDNPIIKTSEM